MINDQQNKPPVAWSIALSDCGGGTGIQADLLTFHDFEVYGCSVITALAAQNSFACGHVSATGHRSVVAQINALDSDVPADVIKVGMIPARELLETVIRYLQDFDKFVIYDPQLDSCAGLLSDASDLLINEMLPRVDLLVVNTSEVYELASVEIDSIESMLAAAGQLLSMGCRSVLITGAQFDSLPGRRLDYWSDGQRSFWVGVESIDILNNRGGGNVLTAAIAAAVARGLEIEAAIGLAKAYVTRGIRHANKVGSGPGSVAHRGMPEDENDFPAISVEVPVAGQG